MIGCCTPTGTRIQDPYIKSVLLYLLSYESIKYNYSLEPLYYINIITTKCMWALTGLNRRPSDYESAATNLLS